MNDNAYTGQRDPINCPVNQPKPTHPAFEPFNYPPLEPKPTGEWTDKKVLSLISTCDGQLNIHPLTEAINAALAYKDASWKEMVDSQFNTAEKLREQLATVVEALTQASFAIPTTHGAFETVRAALAKVEEISDQHKLTGEWWSEQDVDGCWHIGVGNRGFAEVDEATAKTIVSSHKAALAAATGLLRANVALLREQLAAEREDFKKRWLRREELYRNELAAEREKQVETLADLQDAMTRMEQAQEHL